MGNKSKTQLDIEYTKKAIKWTSVASILVVIVLLALFLPYQNYECKHPIDSQIFGSFGDLLSGIIGSIVGFLGAFLLVRTFQNQAEVNESVVNTNDDIIETNKSIVETNKDVIATNKSAVEANNNAIAASQAEWFQTQMQLFDSKFRLFMQAYTDAINSYDFEGKTGRLALEKIATNFSKGEFENHNDYKRRNESAIEEYKEFYSKHRIFMSIHFRTLYLLMSLLYNSDLEEEDKVMYAKMVRGQMSDGEMLLLRYNCMAEYGRKMQVYCNQYNLTKHVSIMSLLEFKQYFNIVEAKAIVKSWELSDLVNGLDSMFITLRKQISLMMWDDQIKHYEYPSLKKFSFKVDVNDERTKFTLNVHIDKTVDRRGGGQRLTAVEKAFDCISENEIKLKEFIRDFLVELFFVSNFYIYNPDDDAVIYRNERTSANEFNCDFVIERAKHLALTQIQKINRDRQNPERVNLT